MTQAIASVREVTGTPDFWRDRKVFVTGASGLLGSWLVEFLLQREADVTILTRRRTWHSPDPAANASPSIADGRVENYETVAAALDHSRARFVFHLAAQSIVANANSDPLGTLTSNVQGTWNVLEACRRTGVGAVVVASSDKAQGSQEHLALLGSRSPVDLYPYGVSKSCAELITAMYASTYSLRAAIARFGNLYGGGDYNLTRTIPGAIHAALEKRPFVMRSDGRGLRNFLYVKDAVDALLTLAEQLYEHPELQGETFSFHSGEPMPVLEVVRMVLECMGCGDLEVAVPNPVREEAFNASDQQGIGKSIEHFDWKARYGMNDALRETISWYERHAMEGAPRT